MHSWGLLELSIVTIGSVTSMGRGARAGLDGVNAQLRACEEDKRNHSIVQRLLNKAGDNTIFTPIVKSACGAMGPSIVASLKDNTLWLRFSSSCPRSCALTPSSPARAHSKVSDQIVSIEASKITLAPEEGSKKTASALKVLPSAAVSRVSTTAELVTPF